MFYKYYVIYQTPGDKQFLDITKQCTVNNQFQKIN